MAEEYRNVMDAALEEALALARHLDGLNEAVQPSEEALARIRARCARIETLIYGAVSAFPQSHANAQAYQALEDVDEADTAANGGDVAMLRAAVHSMIERLRAAKDAAH